MFSKAAGALTGKVNDMFDAKKSREEKEKETAKKDPPAGSATRAAQFAAIEKRPGAKRKYSSSDDDDDDEKKEESPASPKEKTVPKEKKPPQAQPQDQKVGKGDFTINYSTKLGSGGFGTVYKGFDNNKSVHLAVKESNIGMEEELKEDLQAEFQLLKSLEHDHIVRVMDYRIDEGVAQIFMEWMSGGSVQGLMSKSRFRMHEAAIRRYASESLKGLEYLHSKGVLHRDIKPANMLVSGTGAVKISDFGTSGVKDATSTTQHVVGTVAYLSPEAIKGKYSEGSDMWAWACSVVQMATAKLPWSHLPPTQQGNIPLMFHIGNAKAPDHVPEMPEKLSAELKEILEKCFSFKADDRPSAKAVLEMKYFKDKELPSGVETADAYQDLASKASSEAPSPKNSTQGLTQFSEASTK